jgi:glycosyltransferase involved in cell wall biosynthesis
MGTGIDPHSARPFDVVHVFKPIGYGGLAALALHALKRPWVLDVDDWEGPGGWVDVNPYSPAQKLAITVMETMLPRMTGAVTAASRTLEARLWSFGLPRRKVLYMPNGVWAAKYASWADATPLLPAPDGPVVLLYTRFAEFPYRWPLDVLQGVLACHPSARLLVVGGGFFGEEALLQADAARMGLQEQVRVVGRVPETDLPRYLASGDVCIYPMTDNLINRAKSPMKLLEPMLMGLPVVASKVGEVSEFVGDAGVLVPPDDLQAMAEAVSDLLANPQKRKALGQRARERVWNRFNWQKLCEVAERAYAAVPSLVPQRREGV